MWRGLDEQIFRDSAEKRVHSKITLEKDLFRTLWKCKCEKKRGAETPVSPTRCCCTCPHCRSCCPPWPGGRRWHCSPRRWGARLPSQTPAGSGRPEHCGFPPHCSPTVKRKQQEEQTEQTQTDNQNPHKETGHNTTGSFSDRHPVLESHSFP